MDSAKVACTLERTGFGKVFRCDDKKMQKCDFFEATTDFPCVMCKHNLDPSETSGTSEEITDFCFHPDARKIARLELSCERKPTALAVGVFQNSKE